MTVLLDEASAVHEPRRRPPQILDDRGPEVTSAAACAHPAQPRAGLTSPGQTRGMARSSLPSKPCARCGRTITWRKVWARDWDSVRWCSDNCRKHGVGDVDRQLEASLESLLDRRSATASVCPSEAARAVGADDWSELMEPARMAARRLVASGRAEITQGGQVVDPSRFKGPIRVRRPR